MSDPKIKYFYSSLLSNIIISVVCFDNHNFMITKQVKGDDPHKKQYPGPPGLGLGVRLTAPSGGRGGGILLWNLKKEETKAHPGL